MRLLLVIKMVEDILFKLSMENKPSSGLNMHWNITILAIKFWQQNTLEISQWNNLKFKIVYLLMHTQGIHKMEIFGK